VGYPASRVRRASSQPFTCLLTSSGPTRRSNPVTSSPINRQQRSSFLVATDNAVKTLLIAAQQCTNRGHRLSSHVIDDYGMHRNIHESLHSQ
jgi:hypothetical protein